MTTTDDDTKRSIFEMADSITGFEELEISDKFGRPCGELQLVDGAMWARSLVYTAKRRAGLIDIDAHHAVMSMSIKDVMGVFEEESAESGKDEPGSGQLPESSPPSVSSPDAPSPSTSS